MQTQRPLLVLIMSRTQHYLVKKLMMNYLRILIVGILCKKRANITKIIKRSPNNQVLCTWAVQPGDEDEMKKDGHYSPEMKMR